MKTLFLINSPFQALCAISAIKNYAIKDPFFINMPSRNNEIDRNGVATVLSHYGYSVTFVHINNSMSAIKYALSHKEKYERIYVGNYFSTNMRIIASWLIAYSGEMFYLDDGNSTYNIENSRLSKKQASLFVLPNVITNVKKTKQYVCSFYPDIQFENYKVVRNPLLITDNKCESNGFVTIIIGTNSACFEKKSDYPYICYLEKLLCKIKKDNKSSIIYYCPHRYVKDDADVNNLCEKYGIIVFQTQVNVEFDFIQKGISPNDIYGFGSSALYTLRLLYPNSKINNIHIKTSDDDLENTYNIIDEKYLHHGIGLLQYKDLN